MGKARRPRTRRSLASSQSFESFVIDQLADVGDIVARRMFGGAGLYCAGLFIGIIARDVLYLKVDAENLPEVRAAGARPFRPYADRPSSMKYYSVPVGILESAPELVKWARRAIRAAQRARRPPTSDARESDD